MGCPSSLKCDVTGEGYQPPPRWRANSTGNRSHRGDEVDDLHISKNPPPHVGGYQPGG
jgi:hypothetical protein